MDRVALYTSAWIEILQVQAQKHSHIVALYTSAWIEMYNVQSVPALLMSHSTRVRGLKYFFSDFIFSISEVALYTSAWIEISTASRPRQRKSSRTLHECVD